MNSIDNMPIQKGKYLISCLVIVSLFVSLFAFPQETFADLTTGLIGEWRFDEGTGITASDSSGNNNTGTLTNGPTWTTGKLGSALDFDGTNDYVDVPGLTIAPATFTVSFWLHPLARADFNQTVNATNNWGAFVFHTTSTGGVYVGTSIATRLTPTELPADTVELNKWQFFSFTFDNGTGKFYKNGVLLATKNSMALPTAWGGFRIGLTDTDTINGRVDNVTVYNRALSSAEVAALASPPTDPTSLTQLKSDGTTAVSNEGYTEETEITLAASTTDPINPEVLTLFFELVEDGDSFTSTSTPVVGESCASGTAFASCSSKVWYVTSASGDYSSTAFSSSTTVASLSDATGYKWQAKACDDENACSSWVAFNATTPNFTVDTSAPTAPGTPSASTGTTDNTPTWTWTVSADSTSGLAATPYTVQWSADSGFSSGVNSSTAATATFTHSTALADGIWYFRAKASDLVGNESSFSSNGSLAIGTSISGSSKTSGSAAAGQRWLQEHGFLPIASPSSEHFAPGPILSQLGTVQQKVVQVAQTFIRFLEAQLP